MKTYLECIPCFLNQAIKIMDLNNTDYKTKERVIKKLIARLSGFDLMSSPPEFALVIYDIIRKETGFDDLYEKIKKQDNFAAARNVPKIRMLLKDSSDPLYDMIKIAMSGNIMDFAANPDYDVMDTIKKCLASELSIDDYKNLRKDILKAGKIAYIADNAGEIVFDKLLIEEFTKISDAEIVVFVRSRPIVNDATEKDAKLLGLDKIRNVRIEKLRTVFPFVDKSKSFNNMLKKADVIISKGQANYECLSDFKANIYFLLVVKCEVIARGIGQEKNSFVLMEGKKSKKKG